jgi:hypothetical protein
MTIEITSPDIEAMIQRRMQAGVLKTPEDVIREALRVSEIRPPAGDLLAALRSSPEQDSEDAPAWLKATWAAARDSGLDTMTMDEIDAEIDAARTARRQPRP